ncbi:MAG: tetratricopeptide repeat protein, partial [Planctomycetota bacterium]
MRRSNSLRTQFSLALAYKDAGRMPEAIRLSEQVCDVHEKKFGPEHPETLIMLGNLAGTYRVAGRLPEAITLFEKIKPAIEKKLGPD